MDDQQLWQHGLRFLNTLLNDMPHDKKIQLSELLGDYREAKESQAAITLAIDSKTACSNCAGQCCLNGKYRMNVIDALSCSTADISVLPDFLQKPLCPYGNALGCKLEPGFRPADCILFICDTLDRRLSNYTRTDLSRCENAIRECFHKASQLLDVPVTTPLLLWAEKNTIINP